MALGALDIIIAADTAQLRKGMDTAVGIMQSSTKTMENVAKTAAGAIAGYFTFSAIKDSITQTLDLADSLGKLNQKVGISVDLLYSMQAQAKLSDVEFQTLEKSLLKFNKGLGTASMGSGDTTNALKNLNIELKDSSGHLKTSDQYLFEVADRFKGMPDGIAKSTLAMQLFGKSGADMIPLLNGGSESLKEFTGVMDNETAKSAERLNDSFTRMELAFEGNKNQILTGMLPAITTMSQGLEDSSKWLTENSITIKDLTHYTYEAGVVAGTYYGTTLAISAVTALKDINIATKIATISQINFNTVVKLNPWVLVASSIAIATGALYEYKKLTDSILQSQGKSTGSKNFMTDLNVINQATSKDAKIDIVDDLRKKAYAKHLSSAKEYNNENDSIRWTNSERDKLKKNYEAYKEEYLSLDKLYKDLTAKPKQIVPQYDLEDYAKNEATKAKTAKDAEALLKKEHDDRVKAMDEINKKTANTQKYEEYQTKVIEDRAKLEFQADQDRESALKTYNEGLVSAQIETYTAMGDTTSAYYLQEEEKMRKLAETGWYTNEQMLSIKSKDNEKFQKEQWDRDNKFWADTFVNINKAMDDQFFNAMSGKFTSFGDWLKDFWGSITQSMTRGLSKSLADTIMGTGNNSEGGIANWFKSYGGFSGVIGGSATPAALIGATTNGELTTTVGGTVLNTSGQIVTAGSDSVSVLDALNTASTANSMYSAFTGGISGTLASGSASLSGIAYNAGWTSAGDFFAGGASGAYGGGTSVSGGAFGTGQSMGAFANGAAQVGAAYMAAYYTGRGIDKLTGSDTYSGDVYGQIKDFGKMSTTDKAILATLSMIPGGSILAGGLIGKSHVTGIFNSTDIYGNASASNINGRDNSIIASHSSSWFGGSDSYAFQAYEFTESTKKAVQTYIGAFDTILNQMGVADKLVVSGGTFPSLQSFLDNNIIQGFFSKLTTTDITKVMQSWKDYASSINKTVIEAISTGLFEMVSFKRSFTEWNLGSGSVDQLKFTADYLAKDFNLLSNSMGVSGLTVQNYLQKYDEAMQNAYTPETIKVWDNLGTALMSATDANTKYTESLKNVQNAILPQDMNLSKGIDASQIYQTSTTQNDTLKYSFVEMISVLRNILYNQQFNGLNVGIPAP